jgi:lysophospholipase L1-like esterase
MSRRRLSHQSKTLLSTALKLLFGVVVFGSTVGAYSYLAESNRMRSPMPDNVKSAGRCAVWLVGSSSIYRWKSAASDLEGWEVNNRGIEGARLPELEQRLSLTADGEEPAAIVLYAGENDLADGIGAPLVLERLEHVAGTLLGRAPRAKLFLVSVKPSPARWDNRPAQLAVSAGLKRFGATRSAIDVIEAGSPLLVDGTPGPFFENDGIHLSPEGYQRWGGEIERHLDNLLDKLGTCHRPR